MEVEPDNEDQSNNKTVENGDQSNDKMVGNGDKSDNRMVGNGVIHSNGVSNGERDGKELNTILFPYQMVEKDIFDHVDSNKVTDSPYFKTEMAFFPTPEKMDSTKDSSTDMRLSVQSLASSTIRSRDSVGEADCKLADKKKYDKNDPQSARRKMIIRAVVLLCLAGGLQGVLVNGLINVVISSIQRRFGITSTDIGFIANSYDIASFLCLLPVSYLGGRGTGTKPVWIGVGMVIMGLGALLFSLPHFAVGEFLEGGESGDLRVSFCNITGPQCDKGGRHELEPDLEKFKFVLMLAQLLHGAGAAPLYTLGVTYIDENVGASSSAQYLGIFYTMAIVGPAIGYSIGGQLLNLHTDFLTRGVGGEDVDPEHWVGAWWVGFVLCGVASLLLAWPIAVLPASMPGMEEPSRDQVCRSSLRVTSRNSSFRSSIRSRVDERRPDQLDLTAGTGPLPVGKELVRALVLLVTNPTFIFVSLAGASEGFLMQGLATFLPKLIQNTYSLTASQSAINVGAISVVAGGGGTLVGGMVVKKLGLLVPGLLKMTSTTQLVAIVMAIGLMAGCSTSRLVGLSPSDVDRTVGDCGCSCDTSEYRPVCGSGRQFLNPCFAGCQTRSGEIYYNCTCITPVTSSQPFNLSDPSSQEATKGLCEAICPLMPLFLLSFFMTMLVTFLANMPALTATLRCVDPSARSLALGVQWLLVRLLGTIPGPVAMGRLFDNSCTKWEREAGECPGDSDGSGACILYDNETISSNIMILTAVCKGLSIVFFISAMRLYTKPEPETENNNPRIGPRGS